MGSVSIFWLQVLASLGVFSLITVWYVWPRLTELDRDSSLSALLFVNVFRYVGMALLVKGMVDPRLSHDSLAKTAYGDLAAATLALAAIFALRGNWRFALPVVWVANTWGFVDLLNALRSVIDSNVPSFHLASIWWIYVLYAPLVIISEILIFTVLVKSKSWTKATAQNRVDVPG